jgi:hypothetical protein
MEGSRCRGREVTIECIRASDRVRECEQGERYSDLEEGK